MSEIPQSLIIFSTVYAISIGIIVILFLQIKNNLNASETEHEKLLKLVEDNLEVSKQVVEKTGINNKSTAEASQILRSQVENILELAKNLENNFNLLQAEYPLRLIENNQALSDKMETFSPLPQQIDSLTKISTSLENRFDQMLETDNTNRSNITQIVVTTHTLSEKLDELIPGLQIESLAESTRNLENRFTQLLEADHSNQEKLAQVIEANQVLSDKFDLTPVQNRVDSVIANHTNLENRLTRLLETQNQSVAKLTLLVQDANSQLEEKLTLTQKSKDFDVVKSEITKLIETNADLEASLTQFMEQKTKTRGTKKGFG